MRRREFITLLGGAAVTWPLAARAQQLKPRSIGFMGASTPVSALVTALVQRLRELGWIEGRNIAIEYRWAEGQFERLPGFATEFVRQGVDMYILLHLLTAGFGIFSTSQERGSTEQFGH